MMPLCPCGSGLEFSQCCEPFILGLKLPESAEQLMRSRYCAYQRQAVDYLRLSWHPDTCPERLDFSGPQPEWLGLKILSFAKGGAADATGVVEFRASYRLEGKLHSLHETSRFVQQAGRWLYVDGDIHPELKPGRNDPCPCGSGKKYKKCCDRG